MLSCALVWELIRQTDSLLFIKESRILQFIQWSRNKFTYGSGKLIIDGRLSRKLERMIMGI